MSEIPQAALSLTALAVEYGKAMAAADATPPRDVLRDVLRYLPRIYITVCDLDPYGEGSDDYSDGTGMISDAVTEEQYAMVQGALARCFGEYDMYLDAPAEDMRYSDTPVAVSLAEQLADIFQSMTDFAATMSAVDPSDVPAVLADLKYRFGEYLSDTLCSALRAANYIYHNASFES